MVTMVLGCRVDDYDGIWRRIYAAYPYASPATIKYYVWKARRITAKYPTWTDKQVLAGLRCKLNLEWVK